LIKEFNKNEMNYLAEIIVRGKIGDSTRIQNLNSKSSIKKKYKFINEKVKDVGDFKTQLWLPLPIEEKVLMYLG